MAKYSYEFKLKVVHEYINGEGGYKCLAKKHDIPSYTQIKKWVATFKEFGKEGLIRSRQNHVYSFQFKLHVVELYLSSEVSYQELALSQKINNPSLIANGRASFIYSVNNEKPNFVNRPDDDYKSIWVEKITDHWYYACVQKYE